MNIILFEKYPENSMISLSDERAQHIINILKLKVGDSFKMGIVNQSEGMAVIKAVDEEKIQIDYAASAEPVLYDVTLLVAQVRPICMKRILREAVSLGVGKIILTGSETGEKSYLSSNLYKTGEYMDYIMDGAMQSSHAGVPNVVFASSVREAVAKASGDNLIMLDNISGSVPLSSCSLKGSAVLAVGPERGWTDNERKVFLDNGYKPMLLGSRVLRTETACSAGVAVLLSRMNLL